MQNERIPASTLQLSPQSVSSNASKSLQRCRGWDPCKPMLITNECLHEFFCDVNFGLLVSDHIAIHQLKILKCTRYTF